MSGISSTASTSNLSTNNIQTNVGPITFTGISSGIDWNSVIQKETQLTLAPTTQYQNQITTLSQKNAELIKINGLLGSLQNALVALSDPSQYQSYVGVSSNPTFAVASGTPGVAAAPGTYTIMNETLATSTQVTSAPASVVGYATDPNAALNNAHFQISPTVGSNGQGTITIDGVSVKYSLTDSINSSLNALLATIQFQVDRSADPGFQAYYDATTDRVVLTSSDAPIAIGSQTDTGNLETVLKLDIASVANTSSSGFIESAGPIGGLNPAPNLDAANLITAVTSGTFSINGVSFSVDPTNQSLNDIIAKINASNAGVIAAYNSVTGQITITSQQTGPKSIVFGSPTDTSNFLSALGLPDQNGAHGATVQVGQQASVTLLNPAGGTTTVYSNSNQVTNAIPGMTLNLLAPNAGTPFTINVSQDSTTLANNIQAFASAYNAAMNELNSALAAPIIQQSNGTNSTSTTVGTSSQLTSGGILFGDLQLEEIRNQLVNYAQSLVNSAGTSYNSLDAIGLPMTSTFSQTQASQAGDQNSATQTVAGGLTTTVMDGTDGTFQPFNLQTFQAAFAADPTAIQDLFMNPTDGIVTQFGSYLTTVTGSPTILQSGESLGEIPQVALLQADENSNSDSITSLQQLIQQIQDNATMQANLLQQQANAAETAIAGYQATQAQITQLQNSGQL
jgi:flagellar hook-associated protein 2